MASWYSVLIVTIIATSVNHCSAITEEQKEMINEKVKSDLTECGPKFGVTFEQMLQWKEQKKIPDSVDKCFYACMMKKNGLIDEKGLFSLTVALEMLKLHVSEDKLADATASIKTCAKVNEESVSDGDAGCERAALLIKCVNEHKELIGFNIAA